MGSNKQNGQNYRYNNIKYATFLKLLVIYRRARECLPCSTTHQMVHMQF